MTPEKQDKTLELSKHWSVDSTPARNEVIMKRTYPVKSISFKNCDLVKALQFCLQSLGKYYRSSIYFDCCQLMYCI